MKIHPLFEEVLTRAIVPSTIQSAWDSWVAAGKPVLAEEDTPDWKQYHKSMEAKDARILDLEAVIKRQGDVIAGKASSWDPYGECLRAKDARIKDAELEIDIKAGQIEMLHREIKGLEDRKAQSTAGTFSIGRNVEIDRESIRAEVRAESAGRIKELETVLSESVLGRREVEKQIRNDVLEEAAKQFECLYTDTPIGPVGNTIARKIREMKR